MDSFDTVYREWRSWSEDTLHGLLSPDNSTTNAQTDFDWRESSTSPCCILWGVTGIDLLLKWPFDFHTGRGSRKLPLKTGPPHRLSHSWIEDCNQLFSKHSWRPGSWGWFPICWSGSSRCFSSDPSSCTHQHCKPCSLSLGQVLKWNLLLPQWWFSWIK